MTNCISWVTLTLIFLCAQAALGQSIPTANETPAVAEDSEMIAAQMASIGMAIEGLKRLENQIEGAPEGIRVLVQRRADDQERLIAEELSRLAQAITRTASEGGITDATKEQVIAWLELMLPRVSRYVTRNFAEIVERLAEETALSPSEAAASAIEIDQAMRKNVRAYTAFNRILDDLAGLGVDVTEGRTALIDRVRETAEMLATAVKIDSERLQKLRYRINVAPDDADLQTLVRVADLKRDSYARMLGDLSNLLNDLGDDPSRYRSVALLVTGDVSSQILDTGVVATLAKQWSKAGWDWVVTNGLGTTIKVFVLLLLLVGFRSVSRLVRRGVERALTRSTLSTLLRGMIVSIVGNIIMAVGIMIVLSQVGISVGPLLAGLGVLGFIVGFALQDTLGNFAAGMMILMYRPYDVEDVISAAGVTGKVDNMSLVYTTILTFDNQKLIVPNRKIWGDVIQNVTAQKQRRVDLGFSISYSDDVEKAEKLLADIVAEHELTLDEPAPVVKLQTLTSSSVDFIVRPWVKTSDYWSVYWDITREVKLRFDREGISIPFPQQDVHHHYEQVPAGAPTP